uniref:Uncharacterized protein n=1 Tax=Paramormyrops kingsleyae TaxID=1676925 RepID=A0A3B3RJ81_9TELE
MFSRIARSAASTARTLCTSSQNNAKVTVLGASRGIGQPVTAPEEGSPCDALSSYTIVRTPHQC